MFEIEEQNGQGGQHHAVALCHAAMYPACCQDTIKHPAGCKDSRMVRDGTRWQ